jgi:hypothetical protein
MSIFGNGLDIFSGHVVKFPEGASATFPLDEIRISIDEIGTLTNVVG